MANTSKVLPATPVASEWQPRSHSIAGAVQQPLFSDENLRREAIVTGIYDLRRRVIAKAGGADRVVSLLDEKPSYLATLSKCLNRSEDNRRYQVDWDSALLLEAEPATELIHGTAALAGLEVIVRERVAVDPADEGKAAVEVLRDLQRAGINTGDLLNRKLGVRPGTVKL